MSDLYTFSSMALGVIVWALRLEGRVNTQAKSNEQFQESITAALKSEFTALDTRLGRIETAIINKAYDQRK